MFSNHRRLAVVEVTRYFDGGTAHESIVIEEVSMSCGLSGCDYAESYGEAELFLSLMGTGTTRSLYMLTVREADTHRPMFDVRVEAELDDLMERARRTNRPPDDELRAVGVSYARYLVDGGAYRHAPHFRLEIGDRDEVLEPLVARG